MPPQEGEHVLHRFHVIQDAQKLGLSQYPAFARERNDLFYVIKTADRQRSLGLDQADCFGRFLLPVPNIAGIKNRSKF